MPSHGPPVGAERGQLGLPRLFARLPHHPGPRCVQQRLAPLLQLPGPQRLSLLVDPSAKRKRLRRPHFDLDIVGNGVETGDLVLLPPPEQGLVALQPHQGLRPVDPGAQERRDRRGVARAGEVEQGSLGGGLRVVVLLVLAITLAAGPDDLPFLVTPDVNLALPARERAGSELLNKSLIMTAEPLERTATRGRNEALATMLVGSSPGSRNTGTMILATFVLPSWLSRRARPMFWTISTWEPRVSAKQMASTPRSPVMSII